MWDFEFGLGVLRLLISGFRVPVCKVLALGPKTLYPCHVGSVFEA